MSIIKAYTTEEKLEAFLNTTIVSGEADNAINEAVDIIDRKTDRNFIADDEASARVFYGNGKQDLPIDECISITTVELGQNYYGDSFDEISAGGQDGYYLYPANYEAKGYPIRVVHLRSRFWVVGYQNHRITAKWGYSETVPQAIALATTILAGGIYMYNRGGSSGDVKSEKIGNYSVTYKDQEGWDAFSRALEVIEQYRKINI